MRSPRLVNVSVRAHVQAIIASEVRDAFDRPLRDAPERLGHSSKTPFTTSKILIELCSKVVAEQRISEWLAECPMCSPSGVR